VDFAIQVVAAHSVGDDRALACFWQGGHLLVVADGAGGTSGGAEAAATVVATAPSLPLASPHDCTGSLKRLDHQLTAKDSRSFVKTGNVMKQLWKTCRETADRQTERLTSLKTGNVVKAVCRVCRDTAVLETEGLRRDCAGIKAQIRLRFPDAVRRTMANSAECRQFGCLCAACSRATIDHHPLYLSDPTRADRRGIHLHPRCHELWLEAVTGQPATRTRV
jgi:hypothetical protein